MFCCWFVLYVFLGCLCFFNILLVVFGCFLAIRDVFCFFVAFEFWCVAWWENNHDIHTQGSMAAFYGSRLGKNTDRSCRSGFWNARGVHQLSGFPLCLKGLGRKFKRSLWKRNRPCLFSFFFFCKDMKLVRSGFCWRLALKPLEHLLFGRQDASALNSHFLQCSVVKIYIVLVHRYILLLYILCSTNSCVTFSIHNILLMSERCE